MTEHRLAVMQPYLFPYIGYFQLIAVVDLFVFYNDVSYIKRGWINRNRILVNGKACRFTVPVRMASSFRGVAQTMIDTERYSYWRRKFFKTIQQNYSKAPYYVPTLQVLRETFESQPESIDLLARTSVRCTCEYLGLKTPLCESTNRYAPTERTGVERALEICAAEGATHYVNAPGGRALYDRDRFAEEGIQLSFLEPRLVAYDQQLKGRFVPWLSMIDVLMFNSVDRIQELLSAYDLT